MPIHNEDIAAAFDEIADLLEVENANPFRVRAYRNAARTLRGLPQEVAAWVEEGRDLTELPGIGADLAGKITEFVTTGHLKALDQLRREVPPTVEDLLRIPGLGPKRVRALYLDRGIKTVEQLEAAARAGELRALPGFGPKTEQKILEALAARRTKKQRFLRAVAASYAEPLREALASAPGVHQAVIAGSYRRGRETVGDIDILVTAERDSPVMQRFTGYDEVAEVVSQGTTRATVILQSGLQVDLRVVAQESFGAALQYFTGSKAHNIEVRRLGQDRDLKINEYGVFRGGQVVAGDTEESVYAAVDLPWIPPELREARGEIEAAQRGRLPALVSRDDLHGDLHCHTSATDGKAGLEAMVSAAREAGLEYLAITDHSHHLRVARGLDASRLLAQMEAIDRLNERLQGFRVLKGIEVDILEDGRLDLDDDVLCRLDLVVAAVHSQLDLPRARQTRRILRAMDSPCFTILAHPSGRLLGTRPAMDVDMAEIIRHAAERGCYLELNSHPERLDLDDVNCMAAREAGVLVSINSDAHTIHDFANLAHGVLQARRGWLGAADVLNTRSLEVLLPLLQRTMHRPVST